MRPTYNRIISTLKKIKLKYLLSRRSISAQGRWVTDVLMVTTTMRMLNGVHGDTSNLGPHLSLSLEEVVAVSCLENGFLDSPTSSDNAYHGSGVTWDGFSGSGGQSDSGFVTVLGVTDDGGIGAWGSGHVSLVAGSFLDIADSSTFGDSSHGQDVTDGQLGCGLKFWIFRRKA